MKIRIGINQQKTHLLCNDISSAKLWLSNMCRIALQYEPFCPLKGALSQCDLTPFGKRFATSCKSISYTYDIKTLPIIV